MAEEEKTEQQKIDEIVKKHRDKKEKDRVVVTYDENGNRYVHVDGEWIG